MRLRGALAVLLLAPAMAGASSASGTGTLRGAVPAAAADQERAAGHDDVDHGGHGDDGDHGEHSGGQPAGHEHDEGLALAAAAGETVAPSGTTCADGAEVRDYDIAALGIDLTLNRYGDHDPEGRVYAPADEVDDVRAAAADGAAAVSVGLQGDVIQPLVLRVRPGECLRVTLDNQLEDEPASFHLHASSLVVATTGQAATEANADAMAAPGESVTYEWLVPEGEPEGTHVFHSHGAARIQSGHGLFGTLVVEPPASTWADPRTGVEGTTDWDAVVTSSDGVFREFVLAYHEIGDENYRISNANGGLVPQVDPFTKAYRPAARAINYRSEPFYDRLALQAERGLPIDESLAYSSYTFGDPATPILRTYIGDPVKERVVHAGPEVFHVHHVHGGSVRWRRQPGVGRTGFGTGLTKEPELVPDGSERVDSVSIGPSEAFDVDHECSAGGCQQGAGDYLVHCHIAHHYFAGMWGIWRVYNTLQDGPASTDAMTPLAGLPDRPAVEPGLPSPELVPLAAAAARRHLPPPGVPAPGAASVWDWTEADGLILGEPETAERWPGYEPAAPGVRPPVLFDRETGQPAYPMLRPHLTARPPFAPGHGPSPFLDVPTGGHDPPAPGASGEASLCPAGTQLRQLNLRAIEVPVPINQRANLVDPAGAVFVLAEDEAAVRADPSRRQPLAIRANAGEHCVDVLLTNEMPDNGNHPFSKISAHIHFVQFDVQAGDGVSTGFNYEQSVRPVGEGGTTLAQPAAAGDDRLVVTDASRLPVGSDVGLGLDGSDGIEVRRVVAVDGAGILVDAPLDHPHPAGEGVSTEFVRYRWYPDAQVGTAYFHDHVNGIQTWQHGLVGALVVEPPGAAYLDPRTGRPITSGPIADVVVPPGTPVSADISGSFRELVSFVQDGSRLSHVGRSQGSNLNLRAEPLAERPGPRDRAFASAVHGDPVTPLLEAYVGDPLVVRATVSGTNEVHTWHVDGHWFRLEPWSKDSAPRTTVRIGISERHDVMIPAAGGPQRRPGDYLYGNGRALKLEEGAWGLLRVLAGPAEGEDLEVLPGRDNPPATVDPPPVCPDDAPRRRFDVAAVDTRLPLLGARPARVFALAADAEAIESGRVQATPLVLRGAVGDCLEVTLHNRLPEESQAVSLHADGLAYDPLDSGGVEAGRNPSQIVEPGDERTFTFYAHPEYGPIAALLRDGADLAGSGALGLYGAVVIGPEGSRFDPPTGWSSVATAPGRPSWRDVVVFVHDEDDAIGTHRMPYTSTVRGAAGLNYRNDGALEVAAYAGDPIDLHVVAPWSEQVQVFALENHRWPIEPAMDGSTLVGSSGIGGLESLDVVPRGGAGGDDALPGTYRLGNHREAFAEVGMTGRLVVHPACGPDVGGVARLSDRGDLCNTSDGMPMAAVAGGAGGVLLVGLGAVALLRRRRSAEERGRQAATRP